jgi:hypothetical protein
MNMPRLWYIKQADIGLPDFMDVDGDLSLDEQWKRVENALDKQFANGNHWEHVTVLYAGKRAHMFVDEVGKLKNLPLNPKASLLYLNVTNSRIGRRTYDDVTVWEPPYDVPQAFLIAGPALLWTGELE